MLVCLLIAQIEVEYTMRLYLYVYDIYMMGYF